MNIYHYVKSIIKQLHTILLDIVRIGEWYANIIEGEASFEGGTDFKGLLVDQYDCDKFRF